LVAVIRVLARLRYNDPGLLAIPAGKQAMIELPLIEDIVSEARHAERHEAILRISQDSFRRGT
jgi:hypothetical protein